MPLYEYKCNDCDNSFEVLQKINDDPLTKCIYCQGNVEKLISVSSFQLKGSGWYMNDYKKKSVDTDSYKQDATTKGGTQNASTNK